MQRHAKIEQYLDLICNQIRCKKIHNEICEEIENHINDQKDAYKVQGIDEETATLKAIEQMGDPVIVGTELDRSHRPKPEWSIIVLTLLLLVTGIVIRSFTSPQDLNGLELFNKQLVFTVVGIGLMILCYYIDFTFIGKYPKIIFLLFTALIIILIAKSTPVNGRYIYASYLLLLFPTLFAGIVYNMRNKGYLGIIICGLFLTIPFVISRMVSSFAFSIIIVMSCFVILTIAVAKKWFRVKRLYALLLIYLPAIAIVVIILASNSYFLQRIINVLFPSIDPTGSSYIINVINQLLLGAKFIGQGILPSKFQGMSAAQCLPGVNNDFFLTYITHRFGWVVSFMVVILLTVFIIRAFILCTKQKSVLALLVSTAATLTIAIQTFFYIMSNLGFMLFAPLSLPLISQSSGFLLINMSLVGVLLSVFRTGYFIKDEVINNKGISSSF